MRKRVIMVKAGFRVNRKPYLDQRLRPFGLPQDMRVSANLGFVSD